MTKLGRIESRNSKRLRRTTVRLICCVITREKAVLRRRLSTRVGWEEQPAKGMLIHHCLHFIFSALSKTLKDIDIGDAKIFSKGGVAQRFAYKLKFKQFKNISTYSYRDVGLSNSRTLWSRIYYTFCRRHYGRKALWKYRDMMPESLNNSLLNNGSLTHFSMKMRVRGDRLAMERVLHVNGINKSFHRHEKSTNIFHGDRRLYKRPWRQEQGLTRVEAGSNTSTVTLRVVGADEKGSLKSETVKYGLESQGTRPRERLRWQEPAAHTNDRPVLSLERAPHKIKTVAVK
jgi:hypothetical protein